ncbi:MAG: o-succinylbenzoate synthase [Crocinitomicaceae bacterium]|nr:o-succinylbenzoate synthase [Crocinitomicaceae bacterium]
MLAAEIFYHNLNFIIPGGTSRGILKNKPTWYIKIYHNDNPSIFGLGECGPIQGLSIESGDKMMDQLKKVQESINDLSNLDLSLFPSINFGIENALKDLKNGGKRIIFKNSFLQGKPIKINGLIWMGDKDFMINQIKSKIEKGFSCLKLKIGYIDFKEEISILKNIRKQFSSKILEIRVDANGAFSSKNVLQKLDTLGKLEIHSIEQPIAVNQWDYLKEICEKSPIPIALDEELIQLKKEKNEFIKYISPQYLVLKPTLIGGFEATKKWITIAEENHINWWVTSALESNVGLSAIAQFCANYPLTLPQGLGTGQLFSNNIPSPLEIKGENIFYNENKTWNMSDFEKIK